MSNKYYKILKETIYKELFHLNNKSVDKQKDNKNIIKESNIESSTDNIVEKVVDINRDKIDNNRDKEKSIDKSSWKQNYFSRDYLNQDIIEKMSKKFIALDLETTGLNRITDKIIEVGMVMFENGVTTKRYNQLINPNIRSPGRVSSINGI